MRAGKFIEKHFWIFLIGGIVLGLWDPVPFRAPDFIPKLILGMMLFLVFLKIDALEILDNIKNYRLMIYIAAFYMFIIPLAFYFSMLIFDAELAIGILLLTAMPAGVSTPALADILKGNVSLSMSLVLVTQLMAPFTVPLLFWIIGNHSVSINKLLVFKDISMLVFLPLIISQVIKKYFPVAISKTRDLITPFNVFLLFAFEYIVISAQREIILANPATLIWETVILYIVFILLHIAGYMIYYRGSKENRISVATGAAYMNNGMAIVLAASYFKPEILVLMVLSELPWNTLLAPFKKVISRL